MKSFVLQLTFAGLLYLLLHGIAILFIDFIGYNYVFLFPIGYLILVFITSKWNWLVSIIQFLIVGFLSFIIIGYLFNKVYEPIIEQLFPKLEGEVAIALGLIELVVIKILSDKALSKTSLSKKESFFEKITAANIG